MFEKEAEENSKKAFCIAHTHEDELIYRNGFQQGAEFGYNKGKNEAKELLTRFVMASVYLNGKEKDLVEEAEQFLKNNA